MMFLIRRVRDFNSCLKYTCPIRNFKNASVGDVPSVSTSSMRKVLKSSNVNFNEGHTCFTTQCPICKSKAKPVLSTLYVNKTTGVFMCPKCKYSGEWDFLESYIVKNGAKPKLKWEEILTNSLKIEEYVKSVQNSTKPISLLKDNLLKELLNKLKLPLVAKEPLEPLDLRVDGSLNKIYFPLQNAEREIVGFKIFGDEITTYPDSKCGGLVKGSRSTDGEMAVLVPNISDLLVLFTSNIDGTIICLPNGSKTLPQYTLPALEKYKKIVIWLGSDTQSTDAARRFGKKLGEKRCYCVRSDNSKVVLPHLDRNQDFKSIINNAQSLSHKSITTFATLRQDVLSDLQNLDQVEGVKWTRFPSLNKILKGHRSGELTVLTGPTGSGKTTFISEYSLDLALQGVSTLWGSFEIRNARLARTMMQQMVGMPLEKNLHLFETWADEFEKLPIYYMTFHGQQSIKVVMEAVEHAAYVHDINHVIIDNLQFMMGITEESKHMDRFWKQDSIVAAFRTFATKKNCHVTLVIHPRKERVDEELTTNSIFGGAKASQEADNVLLIQDKRLTGPRGKKYLQVAKNRYSGDLGVMSLDFNKDSLSYAPKKKIKMDSSCDEQGTVE